MAAIDTGAADSTREQLLNVAEALFLEHGLDEVSLRTIVREAGQRNQSALQYHFGGRAGLIAAIVNRRMTQIEARRRALVAKALADTPDPGIREVCALMIRAPFLLCREDSAFRAFLGLFGQRLLASDRDIALVEEDDRHPSLASLRAMLRDRLSGIDADVLKLRTENAHALALLAISRRARCGSFRGRQAELFFENLADQLTAMLAVPVSAATRSQLDSVV